MTKKQSVKKGIFTAVIALVSLMAMSLTLAKLSYTPNQLSSSVQFKIKNMGSMVDGTLGNLQGTVEFDPNNMEQAKIEATVDVSTIKTGNGLRNKHLQAKEYFNAKKYPQIKIVSDSIKLVESDSNTAHLDGTLSIKGVEKPLSIDFKYYKMDEGYNMQSEFTIKRRDFGVGSKKTKAMKDEVYVTLNIIVE